ncbi:MAG: MFS transporter, partial [Coriobacteriales bacterium]|nr:MFS transporter [Coriobacteriales bacterium]
GALWAVIKPINIVFLSAYLLFNLTSMAEISFAPTFLQLQGVDATVAGSLSTIPSLLAIVFGPLFGLLADRTGQTRWLLVVAMALIGPGCCIILSTTSVWLWLGIALAGMAMGVPALALTCYPQLLKRPELIGVGMGVFNIFQNVGAFLGSMEPLWFLGANQDNWPAAALSLLITGILGTACYLLVALRRKSVFPE